VVFPDSEESMEWQSAINAGIGWHQPSQLRRQYEKDINFNAYLGVIAHGLCSGACRTRLPFQWSNDRARSSTDRGAGRGTVLFLQWLSLSLHKRPVVLLEVKERSLDRLAKKPLCQRGQTQGKTLEI
jgi:hypothetical protein